MKHRPRMSHDRVSFITQLQHEMCACCRPVVRRIAQQHAGERLRITYRDIVADEEVALAVSMLNSGMSRSDARGALMARVPCSRTKAYLLLRAALVARKDHIVPAMDASPAGLRQLALALDDERD